MIDFQLQKERILKYYEQEFFSQNLLNCLIFLTSKQIELPEIEKRDSSESFTYNGKNIALLQNNYKLLDHDLLHEIGHWIFCSDIEQRFYPEYGLKIGIVCQYALGKAGEDGLRRANGAPYWQIMRATKVLDGFINISEQKIQEECTQKFCVFFGKMFEIAPELMGYGSPSCWSHYENVKKQVWNDTTNRFNLFIQSIE